VYLWSWLGYLTIDRLTGIMKSYVSSMKGSL
jgi:hypothetical protein